MNVRLGTESWNRREIEQLPADPVLQEPVDPSSHTALTTTPDSVAWAAVWTVIVTLAVHRDEP